MGCNRGGFNALKGAQGLQQIFGASARRRTPTVTRQKGRTSFANKPAGISIRTLRLELKLHCHNSRHQTAEGRAVVVVTVGFLGKEGRKEGGIESQKVRRASTQESRERRKDGRKTRGERKTIGRRVRRE